MSPPPPKRSCPSPPELPTDVVGEILLHVPANDPARLFRFSLVSKDCRRILSDPTFLQRYREFHRTPPMLGFFLNSVDEYPCSAFFFPTTPFSPPDPQRRSWYVLDARHGIALFHIWIKNHLLAWDLVTGVQWRIPLPESPSIHWYATVICSAEGCHHLDCCTGSFLVFFLASDDSNITSLHMYSSDSGSWSNLTSVNHPEALVAMRPSILVGDALYFPCKRSKRVLMFHLSERVLSVIETPLECHGDSVLMKLDGRLEGCVLGIACMRDSRILIWSREANSSGDLEWSKHKVLDVHVPGSALTRRSRLVGVAVGIGGIFITTKDGLVMMELNSGLITKVSGRRNVDVVIPYMSFHGSVSARSIMAPP